MAPQVVQYPRATSLTAHSSRAVGVEVAGGSGGINPIGNVQPDRQDSTRSEGADSSRSGVRLTATSIFVNAGAKKPLATPTSGGEAWPDNQPTRRATHQRPGATGVEGAGGSGGRKRTCCGTRGRRRGLAGLRDGTSPHSTAGATGVEGAGGSGGHGRASRSTTPSRRLACGDLAGGRARRRLEHQRSRKQQAQPRIPAAPPVWRPPRGLQGLAGLRDDAPSEARGADGERAGRPRGGR